MARRLSIGACSPSAARSMHEVVRADEEQHPRCRQKPRIVMAPAGPLSRMGPHIRPSGGAAGTRRATGPVSGISSWMTGQARSAYNLWPSGPATYRTFSAQPAAAKISRACRSCPCRRYARLPHGQRHKPVAHRLQGQVAVAGHQFFLRGVLLRSEDQPCPCELVTLPMPGLFDTQRQVVGREAVDQLLEPAPRTRPLG